MTNRKSYSVSNKWVKDLFARCANEGFTIVQLDDGGVGLGDWLVFDDSNPSSYEFYIYEKFLNEWSSDTCVVRYKHGTMPKKLRKRMENTDETNF